ncbi:hypothetical protein CSB69_4330 [Morganella morganii]|nr:hypothetical protein CSB69_4330 [Morganella morganii]EMP51441.1 hypothetical protein C790_01156 [Morganella morganii SC01]ETO44891.1 hypothetical protein X965_01460 [Morganella sp. EGD-HP17]
MVQIWANGRCCTGWKKLNININGLNYKEKPVNKILKNFKCPADI